MQTSSRQITPHGFTLIELLVVIAIITLLIGIVVAGVSRLHQVRMRASTTALLNQLNGVLTEYEAQTHNTLQPPTSTPPPTSINSFIQDVMSLGDGNPAEMMLRGVKDNYWNHPYVFLATNPGYTDNTTVNPLEIYDDWNQPIEFVRPDGTNGVLTIASNQRQPIRPKAYFASSGPDKLWGQFTNGNPDSPSDAAVDNLFSFKAIK